MLLCACLPFGSGVLAPVTAAVQASATAGARTGNASARELFRLVNDERAKSGLTPLAWDDRLAEAAFKHAQLMAARKALSHQFSGEPSLRLRLAQTSLRLDRSGENVAYDSTIPEAHAGFMRSPGHRANILSADYNSVGIAAVERDGYYYIVEDFAHRLPELSIANVENVIASRFEKERREARARPITRVNAEQLRQRACSMAKRDVVQIRAADIPSARYVLACTTSDPSHLPSSLVQFRNNPDIASFGVGSCFERTATYPSGVYWIVVALYPRASVVLR